MYILKCLHALYTQGREGGTPLFVETKGASIIQEEMNSPVRIVRVDFQNVAWILRGMNPILQLRGSNSLLKMQILGLSPDID